MSVNDSMAANLKRFREKRKLTQEQLAEMAGCSKNHLSALERGKKFPGAALIENFSRILNVKPYQLLLDESDIQKYRKRDSIIEYVMESINTDYLKKLTDSDEEEQN